MTLMQRKTQLTVLVLRFFVCGALAVLAAEGLCGAAERRVLSPTAEALETKVKEFYRGSFAPQDVEPRKALADELLRLSAEATDADPNRRVQAIWCAGRLYYVVGDREKVLSTATSVREELLGKTSVAWRVALASQESEIYQSYGELDNALRALDRVAAFVPTPGATDGAAIKSEPDIWGWSGLQGQRARLLGDMGRGADAGAIICEVSQVLCTLAQKEQQGFRKQVSLESLVSFLLSSAASRQAEKLGDLAAVGAACERAAEECMASRNELGAKPAEIFALGLLGRALRGGSAEDVKARIVEYAAPFADEPWFVDGWIIGCLSLPGSREEFRPWRFFPPQWNGKSALRYQLLGDFVKEGWVAADDKRMALVLLGLANEEYQFGLYWAAAERLNKIIEKWPEFASKNRVQEFLNEVSARAKESWPETTVERLTAEALVEDVPSTEAAVSGEGATEAAATAPGTAAEEGAAGEEGKKGKGSELGWWAAGLVVIGAAAVFVKRRRGASRK